LKRGETFFAEKRPFQSKVATFDARERCFGIFRRETTGLDVQAQNPARLTGDEHEGFWFHGLSFATEAQRHKEIHKPAITHRQSMFRSRHISTKQSMFQSTRAIAGFEMQFSICQPAMLSNSLMEIFFSMHCALILSMTCESGITSAVLSQNKFRGWMPSVSQTFVISLRE